MRVYLAVGALIGATLLGVIVMAQEGQRFPGPGSGILKVDVVNTPEVRAQQGGEWKVAVGNVPDVRVSNQPTVSIAAPAFLRKDSRYEITWPDGHRELIRIVQIGADGWVQVNTGARESWVNLAFARAVASAP